MLKTLCPAFVDGIIDYDEKLANPRKRHTHFKTKMRKPYPILGQKGQYRYHIYDRFKKNCSL